jgi:hypothetical protein
MSSAKNPSSNINVSAVALAATMGVTGPEAELAATMEAPEALAAASHAVAPAPQAAAPPAAPQPTRGAPPPAASSPPESAALAAGAKRPRPAEGGADAAGRAQPPLDPADRESRRRVLLFIIDSLLDQFTKTLAPVIKRENPRAPPTPTRAELEALVGEADLAPGALANWYTAAGIIAQSFEMGDPRAYSRLPQSRFPDLSTKPLRERLSTYFTEYFPLTINCPRALLKLKSAILFG